MWYTFDTEIANWLIGYRHGLATDFFRLVTSLAGWVGIVFVLCLVFFVCVSRARYRSGLAIMTGTVLAWVLQSVIKLVTLRPRPDGLIALTMADGFSFPSGHALASMTLFGLIAYYATRSGNLKKQRKWIWTFVAITIFFIGFSRVYLGVHWASDVLAGWGLGLIVIMGTVWLFNNFRKD